MVLVQSASELGNRRRHLQALVQEALLALEADVLGPAHETGQIALRLDVTTDAKVARPALKEVSGDHRLGLSRGLSGSLSGGLGRGLLGVLAGLEEGTSVKSATKGGAAGDLISRRASRAPWGRGRL